MDVGPDAVIAVRGLRKRYGPIEAVVGIDLEIRRGEIFAFLVLAIWAVGLTIALTDFSWTPSAATP